VDRDDQATVIGDHLVHALCDARAGNILSAGYHIGRAQAVACELPGDVGERAYQLCSDVFSAIALIYPVSFRS
jgi:hypothetical protein